MKKIYKVTEITIFLFIVTIFLNSCPGIFKDTEYCIIDKKSDYTIFVFVDNEYKNTVTPDNSYKFGLYTEQTYSILCTSGTNQWGPKNKKLIKGKPYTWIINNPPEPIGTPTPEPTSVPTPIPEAYITINNNSLWSVNIIINGLTEGLPLDSEKSVTYTKPIGNYNLVAQINAGEFDGRVWAENINLSEEGYIWSLEPSSEFYPVENYRIWNF